jgi:signal transduction histidine kinase
MTVPEEQSVLRLLSRASQRLAASIDYESTLLTVAGMALPYLGSWCIVDVVEQSELMRRVGIVHPDPLRQEHARRLRDGWPPSRNDPLGLPQAVRSPVTEMITHVSDEMLVAVAHSEENLRDLRALGIGSLVTVPLLARGNVLGAITFVSADIGHQYTETDLRLAEELAARCALALDNARLYRDAQEARTLAGKLNEQLVVSNIQQQELAEEAREANRAKSQFLATFSHEIRTPINAIVGYTDLLDLEVAGAMTTRQREFLVRIKSSSGHLISIIDDILDLAKVESGRMQLDQKVHSAAASIADAIALIEPQAAVAGVSIDHAVCDTPVRYRGDEDRVRQVLVILLSNAVKFTESGGSVTLSCGTMATSDAEPALRGHGPWTFLRVHDTGIGMSETVATSVFEPFVQADPGNTRKRGGAGLGLAIGLELARRMGGDLSLRTVAGSGSSFTLWLPAAEPEPGAEDDLEAEV